MYSSQHGRQLGINVEHWDCLRIVIKAALAGWLAD